jgi:PPK2 family polyphosphate:nucleotide phosphotransferase
MEPHPPDTPIRLTDAMAAPPGRLPRGDALDDALDQLSKRLRKLHLALAAENTRAVLVVLQGRDASGKDGTIQRVFTGLNPAFCTVTSFRRPAGEEARHDYLWRVHRAAPARGTIGVFNRSHYEDVLAVRVHDLVARSVWEKRFDQINQFEQLLTDEGTVVRKFFLHVSREEQRERLEERLKDPAKNWKFDEGDLAERGLWDRYTEAYQDVLCRCSTRYAPWYVVPADKNKPRDCLVLEVLVRTLEAMDPQYPKADAGLLERLGKIT